MNKTTLLLTLIVAVSLILSACGTPAPTEAPALPPTAAQATPAAPTAGSGRAVARGRRHAERHQ